MPKPGQQTLDRWNGGEVRAGEPQRIPLNANREMVDFDLDADGLPVAAPGYAIEFQVPRAYQLADMEDDEDAAWGAGDAVPDEVNFSQGFKSQKHVHPGAGILSSSIGRDFSFLGTKFSASSVFSFWFFHTTLANVDEIEIRFKENGGDFFSITIPAANLTALDNSETFVSSLRSLFTVGLGTPDWSLITAMEVRTTATGATEISFDDFKIAVAITPGFPSDPITGMIDFQRSNGDKYVMVASGDSIYSWDGVTLVRRQGKLTLGRMVHFLIANDMVISCNGLDNDKRWDPDDPIMMDLGVPAPEDALTLADGGAGGNVQAGDYTAVYTFDMGKHGEGNPSPAPAVITVVAGNSQIDYSDILPGPPGTVRRIIYRTKKDTPNAANGPFYLDEIIEDNTTTVISSSHKDDELGAALVADGNMPQAFSKMVFANNTLYGINPPLYGSSLFYSDRTRAPNRTIEQWKVENEFKLDPDDGDKLLGLRHEKRYVIAAKRKSFWVHDPYSLTTPQRIRNGYGVVSDRILAVSPERMYGWNQEFGPFGFDGANFQRIGRAEETAEVQAPDVRDINTEFLSTSVASALITSQDDFNEGTPVFSNCNADDFPNSVIPNQDSAGFINTNLATQVGSVASQGNFLNASGANPDNVRDGSLNTFWSLKVDAGSPPSSNVENVRGSIIITLPEEKKLTHAEFTIREGTSLSFFQKWELYYFNSAGQWILLDERFWQTRPGINDNFFVNFAGVETTKLRLHLGSPNVSFLLSDFDNQTILQVREFRVFEQGFQSDATYETSRDLGIQPSGWGRLSWLANLSGGSIRVYMKSAPTNPDLATATYFELLNGQTPAVGDIPLYQNVGLKVVFTGSNGLAPRLDELLLTFLSSPSSAIQPLFESSAIYFEDRVWFNVVGKDATVPGILWKFEEKFGAWTRHLDYQMSCWITHRGALLSGSATHGKVYRHVRDAQGNRILDKEGRPMLCRLKTGELTLGDQARRKTMYGFVAIARNESEDTPNLLNNGDFESWAVIPDFWTVVGNLPNRIRQETRRQYVVSGSSSAEITKYASTGRVYVSQPIPLLPFLGYTLRFSAKANGDSPNFIRVAGTVNGVLYYLQDDGTWDVTNNDLFDNATFEDRFQEYQLAFTAPPAASNFGAFFFWFGYNSGGAAGTAWLDNVSVIRTPSSIQRRLFITPYLDGVPDLPARVLDLVAPLDDKAVRSERFHIDVAEVKNISFLVEHQEVEAKAKLMGLIPLFAPETLRDDD